MTRSQPKCNAGIKQAKMCCPASSGEGKQKANYGTNCLQGPLCNLHIVVSPAHLSGLNVLVLLSISHCFAGILARPGIVVCPKRRWQGWRRGDDAAELVVPTGDDTAPSWSYCSVCPELVSRAVRAPSIPTPPYLSLRGGADPAFARNRGKSGIDSAAF